MWSLGCLMFVMICGKLPFSGRSEYEIVSHLSYSNSLSVTHTYVSSLVLAGNRMEIYFDCDRRK